MQFEIIDLVFPFWEEPEPEPGDGDGDPAGGVESGDESGEDSGADAGGETGGETGDTGPGLGVDEEGCNCSASSEPVRELGWTGFALLALLGWRRRTRHDAG